MRKWFGAAVPLILSLLASPVMAAPAQSQQAHQMETSDLAPFMDGLVPYAIRRADIPGAVVTIVKDGKIIFARGYGFSDVEKRTLVDPANTLFRPGSTSKLFTWTAVMQQVQAGKINLDADVNQYLDFKIPDKFGKPITMRNLMTHSAGFEEVIQDLLVDKPSQMMSLGDYLKKHIPDRIYPPGQVIAYSNYGASLAGYIVQRVSGEPYNEYIQKHIFTPLAMNHSTFEQPLPANLAPLLAKGYTAGEDKPHGFEYVVPAPAGAATSSGIDMSHFMLAYLQGGSYNGAKILDPATIQEMWTLQLAPAPGMNGFGLGFYQESRNGVEIYSHAGDTDVFHTDLHLLPTQHVGFFMSFNSAGKKGAAEGVRTQIFRNFLDRYYPYTAAQPPTVADPKPDAARVSGWYVSSRRAEHALRLVYALSQTEVSARPDGQIEVSMLQTPGEDPVRWREVGPLYYQQVNGQAHLKFTADANGKILSWTTDDFIPVFIFQRVDGLGTMGSLKILIPAFLIVMIISLGVRFGSWIYRRRLALKLNVPRREQWLHLAARIGAVAFIVALLGWTAALSSESAILEPSFTGTMIVLYTVGLIAILGGIAMVVESGLRLVRGPGGWLVRIGEAIVGLAALYGIWLFLAFGLASFVTRF
ncbi:MAG: serine hydrolase [Candidatus Eremiobacteraeota bacterium]|nr:serine hydrolase [Candidatus Eremiobacteraeota bacterium]